MPNRKEVRWFTRGTIFLYSTILNMVLCLHLYQYCNVGEFSRTALRYEGSSGRSEDKVDDAAGGWEPPAHSHNEKLLGSQSSVFSFTRAFKKFSHELNAHRDIEAVAESLITIDGGPHTLWWCVKRKICS